MTILQFTNNPVHHRQKIFKPRPFEQFTQPDARISHDRVRGKIHAIDLVEPGEQVYSLRFRLKGGAKHQR